MTSIETRVSQVAVAVTLLGAMVGSDVAIGADLPVRPPTATELPLIPAQSGWSFRATPYAWIIGMNGTQTVRGRTVDVDASFIDILNKSDSLFALMGNFEARKGPISLFADLVYSRLTAGGGATLSRAVAPGITAGLGASLGADYQMLTVEFGAAYEIARWAGGPGSFTAIDLMVGGRFWWQKVDVSLALAGTLDILDLTVTGTRATASSGSVNWADPFVGTRLRHQFTPGHEAIFTADIGGFGVGSQFSWQLIGAYSWEFSKGPSVSWAGVVGYRALSVDYSRGAGRSRYEFDMVQHGPILGVSMRF